MVGRLPLRIHLESILGDQREGQQAYQLYPHRGDIIYSICLWVNLSPRLKKEGFKTN